MKVEVQLLNSNGKLVPSAMRRSMRKYTGTLAVQESRLAELGRTLMVANLLSNTQEPVVPALHDAALIYLADGRMRLRGFEVLNETQQGQTWDVKLLPC
jgi:hypothetical protein